MVPTAGSTSRRAITLVPIKPAIDTVSPSAAVPDSGHIPADTADQNGNNEEKQNYYGPCPAWHPFGGDLVHLSKAEFRLSHGDDFTERTTANSNLIFLGSQTSFP